MTGVQTCALPIYGGDAEVTHYWETDIKPKAADIHEAVKTVESLRTVLSMRVKKGGNLKYIVPAKEGRWLSAYTRPLSDDELQQYQQSLMTFYFVGVVIATEKHVTNETKYCGIVNGDQPLTTIDCPAS